MLVGMQDSAATLENKLAVSHIGKHRITSNSTPRYIYPREMKTYPHKNLYKNVCSTVVHNSQKEKTKIHQRRMDQQNMVCSFLAYYPSMKTTLSVPPRSSDSCYNTDKPRKHYVK